MNQKMNTLTKWNPLREFEQMTNRMNNLISRSILPSIDEQIASAEWSPLVDVEESEKEYTIKAELPDVQKQNVKVELENGNIRISGERKLEKEESGRRFHRIERNYGAFERCFTLPEGTERKNVSAEFKDGLLKVHLPKGESSIHKSLEIPVN